MAMSFSGKPATGSTPRRLSASTRYSNIFDIIIDEGDGAAPRERCNVKGGDLTPVQLQPTVSPSPSPSRDHDDDDAFAPPPVWRGRANIAGAAASEAPRGRQLSDAAEAVEAVCARS